MRRVCAQMWDTIAWGMTWTLILFFMVPVTFIQARHATYRATPPPAPAAKHGGAARCLARRGHAHMRITPCGAPADAARAAVPVAWRRASPRYRTCPRYFRFSGLS